MGYLFYGKIYAFVNFQNSMTNHNCISDEAARAFRVAQVDCADRAELHPHPDGLTHPLLRPTARLLHALEQRRHIHAGCTPLGTLACERCVAPDVTLPITG